MEESTQERIIFKEKEGRSKEKEDRPPIENPSLVVDTRDGFLSVFLGSGDLVFVEKASVKKITKPKVEDKYNQR